MHTTRPGAGLEALDDLVVLVQHGDRAALLVADEDQPRVLGLRRPLRRDQPERERQSAKCLAGYPGWLSFAA
jgi:hypothetical protein